MLRYAVLLGLVAICVAQRDHCCSVGDRKTVQKQWNSLWGEIKSSKVKIAFGTRLLLKLVELQPEVREVFKNVNIENPNSGEFTAHAFRILNALDVLINLIDDPEALDAFVDYHAKNHANIAGIKKEHFKTFGQILFGALPKILDEFDALAWKSCSSYIGQRLVAQLP